MASDYGDDAGEKMIEDFALRGARGREGDVRPREADAERATAATRGAAGEGDAREKPAEWAKLDMAEFQEIEDYAGIKGIIEAKLRAHAVDSAWFVEPATGREHLLFRVADARQARAAASALEAEGATTRAATRGPRMQEVRAR